MRRMSVVEPPYQYVRFRWLSRVDLEEAAKDLEGAFTVKKITMPRDNMELSLFPRNRQSPFPWAFSIEPKFETKS